jgi:cytochrome d ubiquinol oxidase subunit I
VTANAWMNAPAGFKMVDGKPADIDPIAAMLNKASLHEVLHMTLAAFVATGFAVAAVHAYFLLRDRGSVFHRSALGISLALACASAPLQILSGDLSARTMAKLQPAKLAAAEAHYKTESEAPLVIGGIPNNATMRTDYALQIPDGLSFLATHNIHAKITGLEDFPRGDWPNVRIVHWAFDGMVGAGTVMLFASMATVWMWRKNRQIPDAKWFLRGIVACGPLGFFAMEAGWVVTEVGRQPWIIYNIMRTKDAVTPMRWMVAPFAAFTLLYIFLGIVVVVLLRGMFLETSAPKPGQAKALTHA